MNQEKPIVNVSDLELVVQIIDICSRRGAFEGKEMAKVGEIRDKISTVVNSYIKEPAGETENVTSKTEETAETSE